jgi:adenine-specific DNA-methyltransferase
MDIATNDGSTDIARIGLDAHWFDYPKPVALMRLLCEIGTAADSIVLDFFAGSGTMAQAVVEQNAADGGRRQFIMIQLNEKFDAHSEAAKAGFATIPDLSKERIRRAASSVANHVGLRLSADELDVGFRALKVDTTNMVDVLRAPDETDQHALPTLEDSVKANRTGEDLLFQVLLDWGLELTMSISVERLEGHAVFVVEDNAVIACFDPEIGPELVRVIAKREPLRAVFRDSGFASDDARINAEQIFREISPSTDVKAI